MPYQLKTFDQFFSEILTDWRNQYPDADLSQGSLIFMKSVCLASVRWGIQHHQAWIAKQIFADTADIDNVEHHASIYGLTRNTGESDSLFLSRLLDHIRRPPAGGNKYDYVKWAKEVTGVSAAYCYPLERGLGTVDVLIVADEDTTGSEIPSVTLIAEVQAYIEDLCPVTHTPYLQVRGPEIITQNVTMAVTGSNVDKTSISANVKGYMDNLIVGQSCNIVQLTALAVAQGAENATITVPAQDVSCAYYQMIRSGVINVT